VTSLNASITETSSTVEYTELPGQTVDGLLHEHALRMNDTDTGTIKSSRFAFIIINIDS
jgi:hypothetical protein